jgi:hypothetical protein
VISPLSGDGSPLFAIAIWLLPSDGDGHAAERRAERRAARLEQHLWRIALEVQASGVPGSGAHDDGPPDDAQSTLRNHLSAMYRKVGVRSQPELLARLASLDRRRV